MFANNEITNRGLLHRLLEKAAREVTMDDRTVWARSIDGAIKDAARPARPLRSRIARPAVVLAAAPELSAVAAILRDETATVSLEAIAAVRAFMTTGSTPRCTAADRSPPGAARSSSAACSSRRGRPRRLGAKQSPRQPAAA